MVTLALKYRPRLLSDLVGQEASVTALTNSLLRAKANGGAICHQSFLFAGVRGTGKTSTARILARALNCKNGPTTKPCGVCDACLLAELPDNNLDIIEIDAASRSSVEDARILREQVYTHPAFCRYRVYIIDEVHMMSRSAFDALLKILEEPPSHVVFILATTELQDVPDTIKSRVQIFPFRVIPVSIIENRLKYICEQEGVKWDADSLRLLAEAGQGSMRDALTALDRSISAGDGYVAESLVREQLGIVPAVYVQAVLDAVLLGDAVSILDQCSTLVSIGIDWINFWRELMVAFRVRMENDIRVNNNPHTILRWARMFHLMLQRERDLRDTSLPDIVVELTLVTAAQLPHLLPLSALLKEDRTSSNVEHSRYSKASTLQAKESPKVVAVPVVPESNEVVKTHPSPVTRPTVLAKLQQDAETELHQDANDLDYMRKICSKAFKDIKGDFPRTFGSLPYMATNIKLQDDTLHCTFPNNVRNSVQSLEQEQANPHLLSQLRCVFPTLARLVVEFEVDNQTCLGDTLRADPIFNKLIADTRGEIIEIRDSGQS